MFGSFREYKVNLWPYFLSKVPWMLRLVKRLLPECFTVPGIFFAGCLLQLRLLINSVHYQASSAELHPYAFY
jgi:hypothetical protein